MIFFECYSDKALLDVLFPEINKDRLEHKHGKGNVITWIFKQNNSIGLIDRDAIATKSDRFKEMNEVDFDDHYKYTVYKIPNGNFIIEIDPQLEGWILRVSELENVDVRDFGFSSDENRFHEEVLRKPEKFKKLLNALLDSIHLQKLKELFSTFYLSDQNEL